MGLEVMGAGELSLPLATCSKQQSEMTCFYAPANRASSIVLPRQDEVLAFLSTGDGWEQDQLFCFHTHRASFPIVPVWGMEPMLYNSQTREAGCGHNEGRQKWRLKGSSEEQLDVSSW